MSILLVGYGYWGKNWANTLYQLGELGGICDECLDLQDDINTRYPGIPFWNALEPALKLKNLEAVVVATPVTTHVPLAQKCLEAGIPVLVEKPLALNASDATKLVQLAEKKELLLAVGHILMYHPALLSLKKLIESGELGETLAVHSTRVNLGKIRNEENCWWSLAPHDLSIATLLLDEPLKLVNASSMNILGRPHLEDSVYAQFETPSKRSVSISVSWLSPYKKHETVVIGTHKIAVFEDTQPPERKLMLLDYTLERQPSQTETSWIEGISRQQSQFIPYPVREDLLTLEARAFIQGVRDGKPLVNDGRNGLHVVQQLETAQQWIRQMGQTPVYS